MDPERLHLSRENSTELGNARHKREHSADQKKPFSPLVSMEQPEKNKQESSSQVSGQSLEELPEINFNDHEILDDLEIDDAIFDDSILISNDLKLKHRFKEYLKEKSKDSAVLSRLDKER